MNNYIRIPVTSVPNLRDLGGYATKDGLVTNWNKFLRSSHLTDMTTEDIEFLTARGLTTVIDLRHELELENDPNPTANHPGIYYYHNSLLPSDIASKIDYTDDLLLGALYIEILKNYNGIRGVFKQIINHIDGTILYHCTAGKDRTGVISMLILGLAGVSKEDIISNYEVSYTYMSETLNKKYDEFKINLIQSNRENMMMAYDYLVSEYGSFEQYFTELGFNTEDINTLKEHAVG